MPVSLVAFGGSRPCTLHRSHGRHGSSTLREAIALRPVRVMPYRRITPASTWSWKSDITSPIITSATGAVGTSSSSNQNLDGMHHHTPHHHELRSRLFAATFGALVGTELALGRPVIQSVAEILLVGTIFSGASLVTLIPPKAHPPEGHFGEYTREAENIEGLLVLLSLCALAAFEIWRSAPPA